MGIDRGPYARIADDDDDRVEDLLDLGEDITRLVLGELLENQNGCVLARVGRFRGFCDEVCNAG